MTASFRPRYVNGPVPLQRPASALCVPARVPIRQANREADKLERRIRRAIEEGDGHRAKGLQRLLLRSRCGKLSALAAVNPVLKSAERARSKELVAIAERMSTTRRSNEAAYLVGAEKSDGGCRPLTIFGLERAALQSLACRAIRPFHTRDPRQFAITGGHNAAARAICQCIDDGYKWAFTLDITQFYTSINGRRLRDIIPLPYKVIEHVMLPPRMDAVRIMKIGHAVTGLRLAEMSQLGISQGSRSSPLIAEIVIKQILEQFSQDVRIINVADDFCIMARHKRDVDTVSTGLIRAAARSPAGRLQLRPKTNGKARRVADGFDFVGYNFKKRRRTRYCEPSDKNLVKFNVRVCEIALKMLRGVPNAIPILRRYVRSWWGAFPLVRSHLHDGDFFWARHHVGEVVRRHRRIAVPLVRLAMDWEQGDYAPLPAPDVLTELSRAIRRAHPEHRTTIPNWRRRPRRQS